MIRIEKTEVGGFTAAVRGMRNPLNSWDRSDSYLDTKKTTIDGIDRVEVNYILGPKDLELAMKLVKNGSVHAKFRRMITVYVDITAPLYWWKEFDTYKVGTVANSCSTMHKIHAKEFTLDDFSCEHLTEASTELLSYVLMMMNGYRRLYISYDKMSDAEKDDLDVNIKCKKDLWWQMIQLLPSSYNQKRTVMLNYEVLAGIWKHRRNHKLDEWRKLCEWIEELPYSEFITGGGGE